MQIGKGKIVIKPSNNGRYKTAWIYLPAKIANDSSFPFKANEEVLIELKNDYISITKNDKRSRLIKEIGTDNTTLPKIIEKKAIEKKNQDFLFFRDEVFTFDDINIRANKIAHGILDLIAKVKLKKPKISLMMNNCPDFIFTWFGIVKAGCILVPINILLKRELLEHVLNDSDTEILIIDYKYFKYFEEIRNQLPKIKKIIIHNAPNNFKFTDKYLDFQIINSQHVENPKVNIHIDDPIEIIYTEGITGKPKGVIYRNMVFSAIDIGFELKKIVLKKNAKVYCPMALFTGAAQFYVIIPSLLNNAKVIIAENFDPKIFWEDIERYQPYCFTYFGGFLLGLLNNLPNNFDRNHSMKKAYGFGAGIELWKAFETRFGITLHECWSHIEGVGVTINTLGSRRGKMGSIGKPLDFLELKIIDSEEKELPNGFDNVGEIAVRSKNNSMFEYYKTPEITDVRISDDGWVYTGDFGYKDEDNFIYFMGKSNEIIYKAGNIILLKEIERITNSHPSVYLSACIPIIKNAKSTTELLLSAVKMKGSSLTPQKLSNFLFRNLAYYQVPRYIEFKDVLPTGPSTEYLKNKMKKEWEIRNAR
jgi:acyl-CoA synthetase (AMP-forming)/AMP-acid ligase II